MQKSTGLERKNREPLYLQVAAIIRREIANGVLKPSERLPSIAELAEQYQVAVVTVRQSIAILEDEGLLLRQQGKGTFISSEPKIGKWLVLKSDWSSLLQHLEGKQTKPMTVANNVPPPAMDTKVGHFENAYRFMRRIHSSGDVPYALIDIYLSQRIYDRSPDEFDSSMVISLLSEMESAQASELHQSIFFTTADHETATALDLGASAPIGDVVRVITDRSGAIIYIGKTKYRGDFVKLEFHSKLHRK